MKLAFTIALRFLKKNKTQTILISLGIAVGISVQIFIGSLIMGLQKDLINTTIGSTSHINIKNSANEIRNYEELISLIDDENIKIIAPSITINAFLNEKQVILKSIDLNNDLSKIKEKMIEGSLPKENEIIVGKDLSEKQNIKIGDKYIIKTPDDKSIEYKVSGIYDLKVKNLNELYIYSTLEEIQKNYYNEKVVKELEIQVKGVFKADITALKIQEVLKDYTVTNWKEENEQLLSGLNGQSISSLMIQIFVMIAVTLAIASVLIISVVQKSKQIGILKAMGLNNENTSLVFLFQGLILGVLGALLGIILGFGLLYSFMTFAKDPSGEAVINIFIDYKFIAISFIVAVASSLISSLIPAINSSKLSPMEVIRNA